MVTDSKPAHADGHLCKEIDCDRQKGGHGFILCLQKTVLDRKGDRRNRHKGDAKTVH